MGMYSTGGLISGAGDVDTASTGAVSSDYSSLLSAYMGEQGNVYDTEATYKPQYAKLDTGIYNRSYDQGISDGLSKAGEYGSAIRSIDPTTTNLYDQLASSASSQLAAGTDLDSALKYTTEQGIRGSQASRGLGYGVSDAMEESTGLTKLGDSLRQERESYAENVTSLGNSMFVNPAWSALSSSAQTQASGSGSAGVNASSTLTSATTQSTLEDLIYSAYNSASTNEAKNYTSLLNQSDSDMTSTINSGMSSYSSE